MLFQLTCILSRHRFPALDTWQASQSCDTLLCSQGTLSPKQAAAAPCSKPSTCPLLFSSGAPWSTSCSAEAELSSSPSLVALRASYGEKTIWRYTLVCRMQCIPAKLGLHVLCGRERKDCFCFQKQPASVIFMFILIYYLTPIFFWVLQISFKSRISK